MGNLTWIFTGDVKLKKKMTFSLTFKSFHQWIKSRLRSVAVLKHLTPNDQYSGRTAPLTSKSCILYIYSTNIVTEYFKRGI